jgi:5-enolpyruvylshikimate-3-phosphate synthase
MNLKIKPTVNLEGCVDAPPSKSYTHSLFLSLKKKEKRWRKRKKNPTE